MRININYCLDKSSEDWARQANSQISALTKNDIDSNKTIPHITLLMGEIDEKDFDKVKEIVETFSSKALTERSSLKNLMLGKTGITSLWMLKIL